MKFTFDRPTKPGPYWFSCEPSKRGPACMPVDAVMLLQEPGKDGLTVSMAGLFAPLSMEWFNGAQWSPRETPADPFATADADAKDELTEVRHRAHVKLCMKAGAAVLGEG